MVGLHALQSADEHSASGQIVGLLLGGQGTLDGTAGPETVVHGAPGVLGIGTKVRGTILASNEARRLAGNPHIDNAVGVDGGLDVIGVAFLIQGEGEVISAKGVHLLIEHEVGEGIGVPDMRLVTLEIEDLGVEVRRRVDTPLHSQEP